MHPDNLKALLLCPLCHSTLKDPTTIRCGHTLCGGHVNNVTTACPLPTCSRDSSSRPNIPSSSRVIFRPPTEIPSLLPHSPAEPKADVVVNKLLALVQPPTGEHHQATEIYDTFPAPMGSPGAGNNSDDSSRPRKRRRRYSRSQSPAPSTSTEFPISPLAADDSDHEGDLLSHLRQSSALQRSTRPDQPIPGPSSQLDRTPSNTRFDKELLTELTCEICFQLFFQPLTTPCQHTFCAKCIHRSLDHNSTCPLCRQNLPDYDYFQEHPYNKLILSIILKAFPENYSERSEAIEAEERDARLNTPIFVCQLSFPGIPTVLHFFEPRYRLMLRRCLESPHPCFGMVMPPRSGTGASPTAANAGITMEYGTMLEIRSVQMLSDGRSMVETWGTHRFRILEKGLLDGYVVGRVERVDDYDSDFEDDDVESADDDSSPDHGSPLTRQSSTASASNASVDTASSSSSRMSTSSGLIRRIASSLSGPDSSPAPPTLLYRSPLGPTTSELMECCRNFLRELQQGTAPWVVQRLNDAYGPPPTDPSSFSFWVALVLPIEEPEKAKLLPIRSVKLRLRVVVGWIEQLRVTWWFTSGCTVL